MSHLLYTLVECAYSYPRLLEQLDRGFQGKGLLLPSRHLREALHDVLLGAPAPPAAAASLDPLGEGGAPDTPAAHGDEDEHSEHHENPGHVRDGHVGVILILLYDGGARGAAV